MTNPTNEQQIKERFFQEGKIVTFPWALNTTEVTFNERPNKPATSFLRRKFYSKELY